MLDKEDKPTGVLKGVEIAGLSSPALPSYPVRCREIPTEDTQPESYGTIDCKFDDNNQEVIDALECVVSESVHCP